MKRLKIVADENIPGLHHYFDRGLRPLSEKGQFSDIEIQALPGRDIGPSHLIGAQMLLVRSITQVSAELISAGELAFVGSCTIGTDHLDLELLDRLGVRWANAPGCNANAVAEYVLQQVMAFAAESKKSVSDLRIGVVGYGNVGRKVVEKMRCFDVRAVLINDPPLFETQREEPWCSTSGSCIDGVSPVDLETLFSCDIVTIHTPLVRSGRHPTYHLIGPELLARMPAASVLINTARGPVIDLQACLTWRANLSSPERATRRWVFDVFEGEPHVNPKWFEHLSCVTPHIAGHSQIGKEQGTRQVWLAALDHFGLLIPSEFPSSSQLPQLDLLLRHADLSCQDWSDLLEAVSGLSCTDAYFRGAMDNVPQQKWAKVFEVTRKGYKPRLELSQVRLAAPQLSIDARNRLQSLGVTVDQ